MESTEAKSLPPLVSAGWLASNLHAPDVVVLDCSWYLPASGRDGASEYQSAHIPGALRFDLDEASDAGSALPHMLPSPTAFATLMERMGIRRDDRVICYDGSGVNLSAARVWWMFRVFGHRSVAVLDGGFRSWSSVTRPVQRGTAHRPATGYPVPAIDASLVRSRDELHREMTGTPPVQVIDCRPAARFRGEIDEPRPGVSRGHIAGSVNLPYGDLVDPVTKLLRTPADLRAQVTGIGIDPGQPIVALCGSGTSACALALAVEVIRDSHAGPVGAPVAIYDGSWSEWGRMPT